MPPGVNFELIKYECSCPRFQEKAACKHAIMLGLHTSKITLPDVCSQTWFRARKGIRSAGRPRKMTDGTCGSRLPSKMGKTEFDYPGPVLHGQDRS